MTREEMVNKMNEIERRRFFLAMKDHWDNKDFEIDNRLFNEWLALKKKVEEN